MKKIFDKKILFSFVLGILVCCGIVYAANIYKATDISYEPSDASWEVSNVNEAINSLYDNMNNIDQDRDWRLVVEFTTYLTRNGYSTSSPTATRVYYLTLEHINGVNTLKTSFSGFSHINGELSGTPTAFCENFKIVSFTYLD